ncbi:hypothetical protein F5888DRAFT_1606584, partial [Russula emetica]
LKTWVKYRDNYLDECMRLEGRGSFHSTCTGCQTAIPRYRCKDCTMGPLWCQACLVERHDQSPLHIMWNGSFFQCATLHDLGLRIQLGHTYGHLCPTRTLANATFTVIHSNAIHTIAIDQCRCHALPLSKQLLCIGWWPATPLDPRSAATFEVLRHYHLLNLQGKVTGYSFYQALEYQTDNTRLQPPPDQSETFMTMVWEWRHTKMLKHAGRAFDPAGIAATAPGSLAIPCRACPLPNVNLPKGWENVLPAQTYVFHSNIGFANYYSQLALYFDHRYGC